MNKIQRNTTCPCGSLKKYKKCCINKKNNKNHQYNEDQPSHTINITHIIQTLKENIPNPDNYKIIDITDNLMEENYREYQLSNMNDNIIMIAEKTMKSEPVFFTRVDNNPNTNIILMYKGSYRTFPHNKFLLMLNSIIIFIKSTK